MSSWSLLALDQLRIEREPEKESSGIPWFWLIIILLVAGAAAAWYYTRPVERVQVRTALVKEVSRALGWQRLGEKIQAALDPIVATLLEEGVLEADEDRLRRPREPDPESVSVGDDAPIDAPTAEEDPDSA